MATVPIRPCWFVNTRTDGKEHRQHFLDSGTWQGSTKSADTIAKIRPGDRIALKATRPRSHDLPFPSAGNQTSAMTIYATGIVQSRANTEHVIEIDWQSQQERTWYFYTHASSPWQVLPDDWMTSALIDFTFNNAAQDYDRFRHASYWYDRFSDDAIIAAGHALPEGTSTTPDTQRWRDALLERINAWCHEHQSPDIYRQAFQQRYLAELQALFPANSTASATIDRQFQALRDEGLLSFIKRGHYQLNQPGQLSLKSPDNSYTLETLQADGCFLSSDTLHAILNTLQHKKNLILQGPPGTGKSWLAKRLAWALSGRKEGKEVRAVQFHPNLSYEDFVRGWRPCGTGQLELIDGPFLQLVQQAHQQPDRAHIMVVEEINRGNPAQIFGELLTLLENSKRSPQDALELSYGEGKARMLYLPKNIYLIGTMNIADRSLALVDLALRRRFAFINLTPQFNARWQQWLRTQHNFSDVLINQLQQRIETLNQLISDSPGLGEQYQIGHSYLTPSDPRIQGAAGWDWFREVINYELFPLLEEYWFDQPQQARDQHSALLAGLPEHHQ